MDEGTGGNLALKECPENESWSVHMLHGYIIICSSQRREREEENILS